MDRDVMVTQIVLKAIQQQTLHILVSRRLMSRLEKFAKSRQKYMYGYDSDSDESYESYDSDDDDGLLAATGLTNPINPTSLTSLTSLTRTTTQPAQTSTTSTTSSTTACDIINAKLATKERYTPYQYVQAKPGQPVWKAVFGSITAATAILSSSPNGAVWNGDDEQTSITYCAHVTQNAKTITVELMVDDELMCTAVLGRKGKLLVLALCRDDQACNLFE